MRATTDNSPLQPLNADVRQSLDEAVAEPRAGDAGLIARVKQQVLTAVSEQSSAQHRTVRADCGLWEPIGPGLERKVLWQSGDALSCLMRLAPGAVAAGHAHPIDEECVVLEGTLRIGPHLLLRAGDFHVGVAGVDHEDASTETGAVVYLRGARPDAETVG